ncbi:MAG: hypothetical protein ACI9JM_001798 [Halioglobus sp.]|jgi:hypothetical protein
MGAYLLTKKPLGPMKKSGFEGISALQEATGCLYSRIALSYPAFSSVKKARVMNRYLLVPLILLSYSQTAAAYLDPGTGSMILQGIIAGIAVVGLTVKTYWYKIRGFFGKESSASLLDGDDEANKSEEL